MFCSFDKMFSRDAGRSQLVSAASVPAGGAAARLLEEAEEFENLVPAGKRPVAERQADEANPEALADGWERAAPLGPFEANDRSDPARLQKLREGSPGRLVAAVGFPP